MVRRAEASQLHLFSILNFSGIAVSPFDWHLRISIRVYKDVEGTIACIELRQKGDRCGNLAENGLNLLLNLLFRFVC